MTTTYLNDKLVLSVQLIPAPVVATGLGPMVVVSAEGSSDGVPGGDQTVADADAADALFADNLITEAARDQLVSAFSQDYTPSTVYVATYNPSATPAETASDALSVMEDAGVDFQVVVPAVQTDAVLTDVGEWLGTGTRRWRYLVVAESRNADLITADKPAALSDCEVTTFRMLYGDEDEGLAGGFAGKVQGRGLTDGPVGAELRILGVDLPGLTGAQQGHAKANDVGVLYALDTGAGATERVIRGVTTYSGESFTASVSLLYAIRRLVQSSKELLQRKSITGDALLATAAGEVELQGALVGPLTDLAAQGHLVPGDELPQGYAVSVEAVGDQLQAAVTLRLGQEVETITLGVTGEVV